MHSLSTINITTSTEPGMLKLTTLLALLTKGGWIMVPLLLLSILALYTLIERIIVLSMSASVPKRWLEELKFKAKQGDTQGVMALCTQQKCVLSNIIEAGIAQLTDATTTVANAMQYTAQTEIHTLEKNLWLLGTIAGAAPMLGFLGTVLGMIQAFMAMAQTTDQVSPKLLSSGIYEAMITTAAGLVVGIIAYISYNYILVKIQQATQRIEHAVNQLVDMIQKLPKPQSGTP